MTVCDNVCLCNVSSQCKWSISYLAMKNPWREDLGQLHLLKWKVSAFSQRRESPKKTSFLHALYFKCSPFQFSSVQSLSHVQVFATPWITARQASLSITNSQSSLKLISIESVMPSSHLILSSPSPPAPNPSQHQSLFRWVNSLHEVVKVLEFQL